MSAIAFLSPAMFSGNNDDALRSRCRSARKRKRRAAEIEVDVLPLYAHAIAEVLLKNIPISLKIISQQTHSSTSHPRTRPESSNLRRGDLKLSVEGRSIAHQRAWP